MPTPVEYVAKDGTSTWRVRFRLGGLSTSETFPSKAKAEAFCLQVAANGPARAVADRARRDARSADYVPTLREWYRTAMERATGITERTRGDYERLANRLMLPMMGDLPLDLIDHAAVARFVNTLERTPRVGNRGRVKGKPVGGTLSAKSISGHHGLLSGLLKQAVREGLIESNPCEGIRLPRSGEHERRDERFLTHVEYERLIACLPAQHRPLIVWLFGSGMRWSEATALQVRHIDMTGGSARVVQAWKKIGAGKRELGPPKTAKSRRTVVVAPQALAVIAPLIVGQPLDAFVFRNSVGNAWHHGSYTSRVWTPACVAAGLDPRPRIHDGRHTHASWLLEAGATLEQVQDQLGHESILTTRKVYGHLQPAMRESLRLAAWKALGGAPLELPNGG